VEERGRVVGGEEGGKRGEMGRGREGRGRRKERRGGLEVEYMEKGGRG